MGGMMLPVGRVSRGNHGIFNDQNVLGVGFLRRFREIERPGDDRLAVNHHHLVVRNGMPGIGVGGHAGILEEIGGTVTLAALALVEDDVNFEAAPVGVNDGFGNWGAGEAVSLNQNGLSGLGDFVGDRLRATASRREEHADLARTGRKRKEQCEKERFHWATSFLGRKAWNGQAADRRNGSDATSVASRVNRVFPYGYGVPVDLSHEKISSAVARLLKEERERRGFSLNSLAAKAGLSRQTLTFVEQELRNPTLDTLLRITSAMGTDLEKIIARARKLAVGNAR